MAQTARTEPTPTPAVAAPAVRVVEATPENLQFSPEFAAAAGLPPVFSYARAGGGETDG